LDALISSSMFATCSVRFFSIIVLS
jgi:hypothetical protein